MTGHLDLLVKSCRRKFPYVMEIGSRKLPFILLDLLVKISNDFSLCSGRRELVLFLMIKVVIHEEIVMVP